MNDDDDTRTQAVAAAHAPFWKAGPLRYDGDYDTRLEKALIAFASAMSAPAPRVPSREEIAKIVAMTATELHYFNPELVVIPKWAAYETADAILALFSAPAQAATSSTLQPEHEAGTRNELPGNDGRPVSTGRSVHDAHHSDDGRLAETPSVEDWGTVTDEQVQEAIYAYIKSAGTPFSRQGMRAALEAASLPSRTAPTAPDLLALIDAYRDACLISPHGDTAEARVLRRRMEEALRGRSEPVAPVVPEELRELSKRTKFYEGSLANLDDRRFAFACVDFVRNLIARQPTSPATSDERDGER